MEGRKIEEWNEMMRMKQLNGHINVRTDECIGQENNWTEMRKTERMKREKEM
jgi:hypothetical protein